MNDVKEDIKQLIKLVRKDLDINRYREVINRNPEKISEIDRRIEVVDKRLEEKKESVETLEKEVRHLKGLIDTENDKMGKKRLEEKDIKTTPALRAWHKEIEYLAGNIERHELEMLETLERIDSEKRELKAFQEQTEKEKGELQKKREQLVGEVDKSRERLEIIEDEKVRILPHISEEVRRQYQRIHRSKGGLGVANLSGDVCQGCFSRLPPQKAHEVRKNNQIIKCEFCGRILVSFPEDDE